MRFHTFVITAVIGLVALVSVGCKSRSSEPPESSAFNSARVQSASFRFRMVTEPASPNVSSPILLRVHVSDASGQPVDGATLRASLTLGGLSSGAQQLVLEGRGKGDYQGWVVLDEAGRWDVNLVGTKDGESREQGLTVDVEKPQEPPTETLSPDPSTGT